MPASAVKRLNHRYPLSDQRNAGGWLKYAPMSDEFNGRRLDPDKWFDRNPNWKGRQPAWFAPTNVRVSGGALHLTMRVEEPPAERLAEGYHTFTSAAVRSKGEVLYGYFEVRVKAMRSHGSSAFWFYKTDPDRWTEIDVFEIGGGAPGFERKLFQTVHVFPPSVKEHFQIGGVWQAPYDLADDWHVYGLEWDEREIKYYLDGVLLRRGPNTHWHQPLWMNFDSETMPEWFGLPRPQDLPSTFSVDYVRAWQKRG
jgi:beta-glucanase (GH16 family)